MGTTTYTTAREQRFAQPAVFVFEVREGKVTRQWDFVDYTVGPIGGRFPTLKRRLGGTACRRALKDASRVAASSAGGEGRDRIRFFQCA